MCWSLTASGNVFWKCRLFYHIIFVRTNSPWFWERDDFSIRHAAAPNIRVGNSRDITDHSILPNKVRWQIFPRSTSILETVYPTKFLTNSLRLNTLRSSCQSQCNCRPWLIPVNSPALYTLRNFKQSPCNCIPWENPISIPATLYPEKILSVSLQLYILRKS